METAPREQRVALAPDSVTRLVKAGHEIVIERGAGGRAGFADATYTAAGASLADGFAATVAGAPIVAKVGPPSNEEAEALEAGTTLLCFLHPARNEPVIARLTARGVRALALELVPRITRAQSMDVLSSMANVAGYRAVIEAAHEFGRLFTGQVTAAGKVPPARVFVVGAGVAGLAAIGAAGSLGAIVRAFDVRPEVAEQVQSMGAQFVTVEMEQEVSPTATPRR